MNRLAILPAAGNALRFGGQYKELLPVANGENALQAAYRRVSQFEQVLIITTPEKIALHAQACPQAVFVLKTSDQLYETLLNCLKGFPADEYYFTMPDTVWSGAWPKTPYNQLGLGIFQTYEPERFGVLYDSRIVDKGMWTKPGTPFMAWGVLCWTKAVRDYWLENEFPNLPTALNAAMQHLGYSCFQISDYHDFANLTHYAKYLACSNLTPNDTA